MAKKLSATQKLVNRLVSKRTVTKAQAERLGVYNLSARICELRDRGHYIVTESNGYRFVY